MKKYKSKFIYKPEIERVKEATVSFNSADDARDAITNIVYFLSNKIGCDHPQFSMHICYAFYSGLLSHLEDAGETDHEILTQKAQVTINKVLQNIKKYVSKVA